MTPEEVMEGSSPHTRGARRLGRAGVGAVGIIPAYAGSTSRWITGAGGVPDHPRIRGEHGSGPTRRSSSSGSSPHTRGAHHRQGTGHPHPGIIPAYAGSTSCRPGGPWR